MSDDAPQNTPVQFQKTNLTHKLIQGKPLSFNNLVDVDAALHCIQNFKEPTCVIVKYAHICSVATGKTPLEAYEKAYQSDPTSAFLGTLVFNQSVDKTTAQAILQKSSVETLLAPEISQDSVDLFKTKPALRVLTSTISVNQKTITIENLNVVTEKKPTPEEIQDLLFAWKVCKSIKSNATVYSKNGQTLGIGTGQTSLILNARMGILKAEMEDLSVEGSVIASSIFLTSKDNINALVKEDIIAIIQPTELENTSEIIDIANEHRIIIAFVNP